MELDQISGLLICLTLASDQTRRKKNKLRSSKEYQNICQGRPKHSFSHTPFPDNIAAELRALKGLTAICFKISWIGNTWSNLIHLGRAAWWQSREDLWVWVWSPPFKLSSRLMLNPLLVSQAINSSFDIAIKWVWSFRPTESSHTRSQHSPRYGFTNSLHWCKLGLPPKRVVTPSPPSPFPPLPLTWSPVASSWKQRCLVLIRLFAWRLSKVTGWPVLFGGI